MQMVLSENQVIIFYKAHPEDDLSTERQTVKLLCESLNERNMDKNDPYSL